MSEPKNFHAGSRRSQDYLYDLNVATPSHAERARTLASTIATGTLCTLASPQTEYPDYPYGSLVTTALDHGHPLFLISGLAEHTRNLEHDGRSSLLLTEAGADNPLALGRITLVGDCGRLDGDAAQAAKSVYFDRHPDAEYYLNFGDFALWKLEVQAVRYIGGFGRMSWISKDEWLAAEPDPLAPAAAGIIQHMNEDHVAAMTDYCRAFSKAQDFSAVKMTGVDRYGFEMSVETADGWRPVRLAFDSPVTSPTEVRKAMVALAQRARAT